MSAVRSLDRDGFVYLIQEYEPFTFPMGTYAALAQRVLRACALRRCSPPNCLRDYFRRHGIGVYADGLAAAATRSRRRSRTRSRRSTPPTAGQLAGRRPRDGCCSTPGPSPTRRATCSSLACWRSAGRVEQGAFEGGWALARDRHARQRPAARRSATGEPQADRRARGSGPTPRCSATTTSGWR